MIKNPVIPGFYPDPSVCRVDDDFYLVCSSFELCPGIPLFHSRDLVNWEQLCNVMTLGNGFNLNANSGTSGVMAPTIRWHEGTFYIIDANFGDRGNFIVTAKDPNGPWSDPVWLEDVPGIDASLFFDDDGKCYITGTGLEADKPDGTRGKCIWCAEFSLEDMRLSSEPHAIWDSALRNANWPEAPHIYKKNNWYYLMIAEGGTEYYHSITMARNRDIFGWYDGNEANPVLTHRHLGSSYPVSNIGHGDLVQLRNGQWYCVMLGSRLVGGEHKNLGRETFICPVEGENDWAVFSPGTGKVEEEYPAPALPAAKQHPRLPERITFSEEEAMDMRLCFWGVPYEDFCMIADKSLHLKCLKRPVTRQLQPIHINENPSVKKDDCISLIGLRQTGMRFSFSVKMHFCPEEGESAGVCMLQAMNHQVRVEILKENGIQLIRLVIVTSCFDRPLHLGGEAKTEERIIKEAEYSSADIILRICGDMQDHTVYYGRTEEHLYKLCRFDAAQINPPQVGGMIGTMLAVFASGNGMDSMNEAVFDWIEYKDL